MHENPKIMKTLKIIFFSSCIVVFCLLIVLIVHIVRAPRLKVDHASWQLSSIVFEDALDEVEVKLIRTYLRNLKGVKKEHFRPEQGLVMFYHDVNEINATAVYEHLKSRFPFPSVLVQGAEDSSASRVCPAMEPDSYKYKFSVFVQELFY